MCGHRVPNLVAAPGDARVAPSELRPICSEFREGAFEDVVFDNTRCCLIAELILINLLVCNLTRNNY